MSVQHTNKTKQKMEETSNRFVHFFFHEKSFICRIAKFSVFIFLFRIQKTAATRDLSFVIHQEIADLPVKFII